VVLSLAQEQLWTRTWPIPHKYIIS